MGSFPTGCILVPLAAFGMVFDGWRLSICSFRCCKIAVLAAEISAPKSGNAVADVVPFSDVIVKITLRCGKFAAAHLSEVTCLTTSVAGYVEGRAT